MKKMDSGLVIMVHFYIVNVFLYFQILLHFLIVKVFFLIFNCCYASILVCILTSENSCRSERG